MILQKKLLGRLELFWLRRHAKRLLFDFDDAIYHRDAACSPDPADYLSWQRRNRFTATLHSCDRVVAANRELAANCQRLAPGIPPPAIIPSAISPPTFAKSHDSPTLPPVVGWVGSTGNLRYLEHILPTLQEVHKEHPFTLAVVSGQEPELPGIDVHFIPWTEKEQYREIAKFDIGIMPLSDDPFSRGKSAYKLLQYLAVGVPVVASAVGMNREIAVDCPAVLSAANPAEFANQLLRLLNDNSLRGSLGPVGVPFVRNRFSLETGSAAWSRLLKAMLFPAA